MSRNTTNALLHHAKKAKNDEFYTQLADIEKELKYYHKEFKGKVIYCNCDDPKVSSFFTYFYENFNKLGIKKLIVSCYKEENFDLLKNGIRGQEKGLYFTYSGEKGDIGELIETRSVHFKGDGDFRSAESVQLLQQSDIVVSNPPFSLFRQYLSQLISNGKQFLMIGNINAITYKEVFKLIKENKVWLGVHLGRGISGFIVPEHYELFGSEARIDSHGNRVVSPNNCLWLTNLDNFKRSEYLNLTKNYIGHENEYPLYDNYKGINVNRTADIPYDYQNAMGVPITFLHKYNPKQFELIKFRKGNDEKDLSINGKCPYFRILIRNKQNDS